MVGKSMDKKVILITGASSGIGKACAAYLSKKDYMVYGTSRKASFPPSKSKNDAPLMIQMDIRDEGSVKQAIEHIINEHHQIDVVINNAGYGIAGPAEETSLQQAQEQLDTNFFGAVRVCKTVLPYMRERKDGLIINISSIGGVMGLPYQAFYSASKYAIEGYTEALRMEVKQFGIKVALLEPGDIQTSFTDMREKNKKMNDTAYAPSFQQVMEIVEKEERNGVSPVVVAKKLEKIINASKPKQRYRVGSFSQKFAAALKGTFPDRLLEWILFKFYHV